MASPRRVLKQLLPPTQSQKKPPRKPFEEVKKSAHSAPVGLTVALPLDKVSVSNLTKLLGVKGNLIKKALGVDAAPIEILLPWGWFV